MCLDRVMPSMSRLCFRYPSPSAMDVACDIALEKRIDDCTGWRVAGRQSITGLSLVLKICTVTSGLLAFKACNIPDANMLQ